MRILRTFCLPPAVIYGADGAIGGRSGLPPWPPRTWPVKRRPFVSNTFGEHWDKAQHGDMTAYLKKAAVPQVREFSGPALPDRCRGRA